MLLLTGCSPFVDRDQMAVAPDRMVVLEPGHTVGQTFVARHGGLNGVEFWLEPEAGSTGRLLFHLRADSQSPADLAVSVLPLEEVTTPGFYRFFFPPDNGSHGMYRYAFLELEYEHHENGAGLLALLEMESLADPELSAANRDYLARNRRGWTERFRATDDAIVYQPKWIYNAYFQALYTGDPLGENAQRSLEWLLLQALPDGAPLRYNHPGQGSLVGIACPGASLFRDSQHIWLAKRWKRRSREEVILYGFAALVRGLWLFML